MPNCRLTLCLMGIFFACFFVSTDFLSAILAKKKPIAYGQGPIA